MNEADRSIRLILERVPKGATTQGLEENQCKKETIVFETCSVRHISVVNPLFHLDDSETESRKEPAKIIETSKRRY